MKKSFCIALIVCVATLICVGALAILNNHREDTALADSVGVHDIFVATEGDDAATGSIDSPLRTPYGAKQKLKELKSTLAADERVNVWFRAGRYEFDRTLVFDETDLENVTFRAYDNETVVFSGAGSISGFQEETVNGVRTFTKVLDPDIYPTDFKSLFSDKGQLTVPRYPESGYFIVDKTDAENDIWNSENTPWSYTLGQRSFYAKKSDLQTDFTNYTDVQVRILHYWHDELMFLTEFDRNSGKIGLSRPSTMLIRNIDRYFFENVFEAMDAPEEWYFNRKTNKLYYVPTADQTDPESLTLYASSLEILIDINGCDGVAFRDIRFAQTDWRIPSVADSVYSSWRAQYDIDSPQAATDVNGVIMIKNSQNVTFKNCEFVDLGADAIKMQQGVIDATIDSCLFRNIAVTAIFAGGANVQPDNPEAVSNIKIVNNDISGYGKKFFCAIGIQLTYVNGADLCHNEISDGFYTGISCGWNWGYSYHLTRNIRICDNLIYNIGQGWLSDMGGIYTLGVQPGTVISGNVIHNVAADSSEGGYGGWGIYLDEGSSRILVENNLVYSCGSQNFNIHYGEGNIIRNNIFALGGEGQVSVGSRADEDHSTGYFYDNIIVSQKGEAALVYMSNPSHFYENGNLYWDLTYGKNCYFATEYYPLRITAKDAASQGYLHNPTFADPLFADIDNFDFTLRENSPAFGLHFMPWDYSNAGTLSGSIIGLNMPGGQTAYNYAAERVKEGLKIIGPFNTVLKWFMIVLAAALAVLWLVVFLKKANHRLTWGLILITLCVLSGVGLYRSFMPWSPVEFVLESIALLLALSAFICLFGVRELPSLKKYIPYFLLILVLHAGVFYGFCMIFTRVVNMGETLCISVALLLMLLSPLVTSIIWLKRQKTVHPIDFFEPQPSGVIED